MPANHKKPHSSPQPIPVILSGGCGTRLWPLSRKNFPKQFHPFLSSKTLFQETALRLYSATHRNPIVVCNQDHHLTVADQMRELDLKPQLIILEPEGRNTAPAIAAAAFSMIDSDPLLLVSPSDHYIPDAQAFSEAIAEGKSYAEDGKFVCFGIVPTAPQTGYGYIHAPSQLKTSLAYKIERFIEKPQIEDVKKFLISGAYYWNSGIFLFKASTYLQHLKEMQPEMYAATQMAFQKGTGELNFFHLDSSFSTSPSNSIDYAIMEKTDQGIVIPFNSPWSDVGSWSSVWETQNKDNEGNVKLGDIFTTATKNCYLRSEKLLVTVGIEDMIIIETADSILVANRHAHHFIKETVEKLFEKGRFEASKYG